MQHHRTGFPIRGLRLIAAHRRTARTDRILSLILAGLAGCANAGGFILLGHYTSHMTGYLSQIADNLVLQNFALVAQSAVAIVCFTTGAASSAVAINWARLRAPTQQYTVPIGIQGVLFLALTAVGATKAYGAPAISLALLCFIMGFQNATITKISYARIRTTHATGIITDVGIQLGRAAFAKTHPQSTVQADKAKLILLLQLLAVFLLGGIIGAYGYSRFDYAFSLPLAAILLGLARLGQRRVSVKPIPAPKP